MTWRAVSPDPTLGTIVETLNFMSGRQYQPRSESPDIPKTGLMGAVKKSQFAVQRLIGHWGFEAGASYCAVTIFYLIPGLASMMWYRIPFNQSEPSISRIPPTDLPKVQPSRHHVLFRGSQGDLVTPTPNLTSAPLSVSKWPH